MARPAGYRQTQKTRERISAGLRESFANKPRPKGVRTHSEETRAKMSASMRRAYAEGRITHGTEHLREWQTKERLAALSPAGTAASALVTKIPIGLRALRHRMGVYVQSARRRKLEWALTEAQFSEITSSVCWYCGDAPAQERNKYPGARFNGIDRVDNAIGYIVGNVVACCGQCNRAKHVNTAEQFLAMARRIVKRHGTDATPKF
jgi:hypothetical protein